MRHEMPVSLIPHPLRALVPEDHPLSDEEVKAICQHATYETIEDYEELKTDYQFPNNWSEGRKMLMLYTANSEFQLLLYLKWINEGGEPPIHVLDKKLNSVARITGSFRAGDIN